MINQEDFKGFSCRIENVKILTDIVNCLSVDFTKGNYCYIEAVSDIIMYKISKIVM